MRVMIATDLYPPLIGGSERQAQLIARQLVQRGHTVIVATVWQPGTPEYETDCGVEVHRLKGIITSFGWLYQNPNRRFHPPFPEPRIARSLRKLVDDHQPDILHSYGWISYSCAVALIGKKTRFLVSARDYRYVCAKVSLLYRNNVCDGPRIDKCFLCAKDHYGWTKGFTSVLGVFFGKKLLRMKAHGLHSNSSYTQTIMSRHLIRETRGSKQTIPHKVIPSFREDTNKHISSTEFQEKLPKQPYILFVGAIQRHKGVDVLLEAYKQLTDPPPLVLIGTIWSDTPCQLPAGVTVICDVSHADVMTAWEHSLFGVIPSLWPEPFGNVVHEGMSKGKAVIGTFPGGHADMISDGESGLLVPSGNVELLVEAMKRLITDTKLRERLGRVARERAQLFTAGTVIPQFEHFYREIITLGVEETLDVAKTSL